MWPGRLHMEWFSDFCLLPFNTQFIVLDWRSMLSWMIGFYPLLLLFAYRAKHREHMDQSGSFQFLCIFAFWPAPPVDQCTRRHAQALAAVCASDPEQVKLIHVRYIGQPHSSRPRQEDQAVSESLSCRSTLLINNCHNSSHSFRNLVRPFTALNEYGNIVWYGNC